MDLEVQGNIRPYQVPATLPQTCFRAYDIRGPVEAEGITADLAYAIGLGVGSEAVKQGEKSIFVGRDGRLSGPELCKALCTGLLETGLDVIFIGVVPTPVLYFATNQTSIKSGVMLTASHNPGHHNGFKVVMAGKTLMKEGVESLYQRIKNQDFVQGQGKLSNQDIVPQYLDYITGKIHLQRPLKVVLDCGNGVAGEVAPKLFQKLGCEVVGLFCEIDGNFPNHHPDPTVPANLQDLIKKVKETKADIGFAFDGDADRLGVVTNTGHIIWPDRQMMLFSIDILRDNPGAKIIFDVKCSRNLPIVIQQHGGKPIMWRTGHSVIKAKLFEEDAPFAGELSGHIFFRDKWFGFDDGLYVGARLLQILSRDSKTAEEVFATLPDSVNTPEIKVSIAEEEKTDFVRRFIAEGDFSGAKLILIDGVRIEYPEGWALVRQSNTSPSLTVRFEATDQAALEQIQTKVREQLLRINAKLNLEF